jgi:tetratricopeptide (TPR) repeat protein
MKVQLAFKDQPQGPLQAAFLRGAGLADWLPELSRWGISLERLHCYVVPQSLADRRPAGLLVILPAPADRIQVQAALPCYFASKQLVLPQTAGLQPAMLAAELEKALRFPLLFLHPSLGLVGWEDNERLDIAALLAMGSEQERPWDLAHPGNAPAPPLHEVKVPQPSADEALNDLLGGVDRLPLSDLGKVPGESEDSPWSRFKAGLLKGGLSMTKGLMDQLPEGTGEGGAGFKALSQLADWLSSKTDGLGASRENALDKLMDMFEKDPDSALRYAIPLDNPFQNRGMGQAGGSLHERDTRFNIGSIGGGLGGNTWAVDAKRYQSLRERYLKAANEAIARSEFEKAAYIYAHLLHDMHGAANVLQQGKMYREAAAIYKEHLKNPSMAAECLEKGGLYFDAIDIYLELERWEKAGDLYAAIGKKAKADAQYERCVEAARAKSDYMEAARLLEHKIKRLDRTLVTLLEGWHGTQQSDNCLRSYLGILARDPEVDLGQQVELLYQQHTPEERQSAFLRVVADVVADRDVPATREKVKEIAYEIISRKTLQGDNGLMYLLPRFVGGDALIGNDVSRFNSKFKPGSMRQSMHHVPSLNRNIHWLGCEVLDGQPLAYGREGNHCWMARFGWDGHVEYYHWPEHLDAADTPHLMVVPSVSGKAYVYSDWLMGFTRKTLPANSNFGQTIEVSSPSLRGEGAGSIVAIGFHDADELIALIGGPMCATIKHFDAHGALLGEAYCQYGIELLALEPTGAIGKLLNWQDGFLVLHDDVVLLLTPEKGESVAPTYDVTRFPLEGIGSQLAIDRASEPQRCIVGTSSGCEWLPLAGEASGVEVPHMTDAPVTHACFLPGSLLVMVCAKPSLVGGSATHHVWVYDCSETIPKLEMQMGVGFEPKAIFPGPERRTFCLLARDGTILFNTIEERLDDWR